MAEPTSEAPLTINTQYVKDLSFENPGAPRIYVELSKRAPEISVNFEVRQRQVTESAYEVVLAFKIDARIGEQAAFLVELEYAGLVSIGKAVSDSQRETLLLVEAPRHLFPFARTILAEATRDGGFPPLMLSPIDFNALHAKRKAEKADGNGPSVDQAPLGNA
ncbi:MAG: protein-export chaperone SecB [Kiloniellales bacterium]